MIGAIFEAGMWALAATSSGELGALQWRARLGMMAARPAFIASERHAITSAF